MAPRGIRPWLSPFGLLHIAKATIAVVEFYQEFVPHEDHATMSALEVEFNLVREFKNDEEVEQ